VPWFEGWPSQELGQDVREPREVLDRLACLIDLGYPETHAAPHRAPKVTGCYLYALAFNPGGGVGPRELRCWDVASGRELFAIRQGDPTRPLDVGEYDFIVMDHLKLGSDGRLLAAPCSSGEIKLWDAVTGKELLRMRQPSTFPYLLAFAPDSKHIVAVEQTPAGRAVVLWEAGTSKRTTLASLSREADVWVLAVSPDGKSLALAGRTSVQVLDVQCSHELVLPESTPARPRGWAKHGGIVLDLRRALDPR
jgi:WD40 repeat protein